MMRSFVPVVCALPALAMAQEQTPFETALQDCVDFILAQGEPPFDFQAPVVVSTDNGNMVGGGVLYPAGAADGDAVMLRFDHVRNSSPTAATHVCQVGGPAVPKSSEFTGAAEESVLTMLSNAGLFEMNSPDGPRFFADCRPNYPRAVVSLDTDTKGGIRVEAGSQMSHVCDTYKRKDE